MYLARTNLRLCHKGSVQSALHDHEVGGAYNSQSGCDQSEGLYHQEGVVYDHQTSSNKPTWQKDREGMA